MRFRSYPKIAAGAAEPPRSVGGPWVALEKIHGAQLVIAVENDVVRFGKRKDWLDDETPFFGWQLLAEDLRVQAREVARALGARQLFAYGELFGGAYPHPEVAAVPGLQAVQTGVWYAPELRWSPFDLLLAAADDDEGEYVPHTELEALARDAGWIPPPRVARGRKTDLAGIPTRAPTRVPGVLGLPPLDGNIAEGLVLKPDARCRPSDRPVAKRKIPEFDDARFDESAPWAPEVLTRDQLAAWAERLVNPARIASARSKVGEDPQAIVEEMVLDVSVDLELAFRAGWDAAGLDGQAWLQEITRRAALRLLGR